MTYLYTIINKIVAESVDKMISVKEECLRINSANLVYYETGNSDIPILFLHGNSSNSFIFDKMYKYFERKYRVIAVDSRGHGKSDRGYVPYSIRLLESDMINFCDAKGLKKVIIIGYSDGGNIALVMADKKPEIIDKLIIISPNNKVNGMKKWFRYSIQFYAMALKIIQIFKFNSKSKTRFQVWRMNLMLRDIGVSMKDLNKMNVKTLILGAENDVIYRKHLIKINKNIKNSILKIIKYTNHFNIVSSEKTIKYIENFIESK